jgi:hypothetical protein
MKCLLWIQLKSSSAMELNGRNKPKCARQPIHDQYDLVTQRNPIG